jgi:integral membrane sensor domain MASE1
MKSMHATWRRTLLENLIVAGAIFLAAVFSRSLLPSSGTANIPVMWPAAGVALAAGLVLGLRVLSGIYFPFAASGLVSEFPMVFGVLSPLGIVVAVFISVRALSSSRFDRRLVNVRDIVLLILCALVPMAFAGFWTANCLLIAGKMAANDLGEVAVFYASAYAGAALVVTPVILLSFCGAFMGLADGEKRWGLGLLQTGCVLAVACAVFSWRAEDPFLSGAMAYLPFPFVVWAALSSGITVASFSVLGAVIAAAFFTGSGTGPFSHGSALDAVLQFQVFIGIFSATGLLIGAGTESRRREKALQAEAATRKAELERLKAQVNPHFLFNCLTAIQSLVRTDSAAAGEGLGALSSLLRKSLDVAKHPLIPLGEELEIIRDALRLQKMRYEEGLEWSVGADKEAEEFRVPPMILQPLVENAVKHGVCDGFGRVDLSAVVKDGDLIVNVRNTAPDDSDPAKWQDSVGLASVRARIEEACPPGSGVEFTKTPERWIQALVRIKGQNRGSET